MRLLECISTLAAATTAMAQSNFDPAHAIVSVDSVGALHWSASPEHGAVVNQFYTAGNIYGANIGWITLGSTPADNFQYRNLSAADFGVNVTPGGELRGFAYGANVGWIHFEPSGNPRVDWITGTLSGRAWSANLGWIELVAGTQQLRLQSLAAGKDSDEDGLPDAWEIHHSTNLTALSAAADADRDGQSDLGEYLAGTSPVDAQDKLSIALNASSNSNGAILDWPTKPGYVYFVDHRSSFQQSGVWSEAVAQPIVGSGAVATVTFSSAPAFMFYRVRAYPPLSAP